MRRRYGFRPKPKKLPPQHRANERIRVPRVLVIDDTGKTLGELETQEALDMAREKELDLVEVSPKATPPVCRIMDFGKFQYQQSKQDRQAKAKQKKVGLKGVRIGLRTDEHDLTFKQNQVEKFLTKGNKVKIEILMKGREKAHQDLAKDALIEFTKRIKIPFRIEEEIKRFPGGFNMTIAPE